MTREHSTSRTPIPPRHYLKHLQDRETRRTAMAPPPSLAIQPPNGPNLESRPVLKAQKEMTKAERRELQEKQRAAKAAAKAAGPSNQKSATKSGPTAAPSNSPVKKGGRTVDPVPPRAPSLPVGRQPKDAKIATGALTETIPMNARGLRIFSHFGLPKPVSLAKGDIHPVILRLALQFSEFKITGANARCIATLTAFKTVGISFSIVRATSLKSCVR
jgi:translation initiation factor eIF-2B subunit delta